MVAISPQHDSSLASRLFGRVRRLAEERDLDLDLRLSGPQWLMPAQATGAVEEALDQVVALIVTSVASSTELHHLALYLTFMADGLQLALEHDATLDREARARLDEEAVAAFDSIGRLGGTLSLSTGRGAGARVEVTLPYNGGQGPGVGGREVARGYQSLIAGSNSRLLTPPLAPLTEKLTPQESTALSLLATGLSNKEIARKMNLSTGTVKFHLAQIYQKLDVQGRGRGAAVARARELGLVFD